MGFFFVSFFFLRERGTWQMAGWTEIYFYIRENYNNTRPTPSGTGKHEIRP